MIDFILKYKKYYVTPISIEKLNNIVYYSNKNWFLQIIKHYGVVFVLILLEYYTNIEDYAKCSEIVNSISNSNKHFGTDYPYKLEHYN